MEPEMMKEARTPGPATFLFSYGVLASINLH